MKTFFFSWFLLAFILSSNSYAQATQLLNPNSRISGLIQNKQFSDAANILKAQGISSSNATSLITAAAQSQIKPSALTSVINAVVSGQINSQSAQGLLKQSQNLGNIKSISDLNQVLKNPFIQQGLKKALSNSNLLGAQKQLSNILQLSANPERLSSLLSNSNNLETVVRALSDGGLSAILSSLGGVSSVAKALTDAAGQAQQLVKNNGLCPQDNYAGTCQSCSTCNCHKPIVANHKKIRAHVTSEFKSHRLWFVTTWFKENVVPALMLMTSQMTATATQQAQIIGSFFDAKHQLETQRVFQTLTAKAHKDYQPSEGMCSFGTNIRSLAASERKSDLAHLAIAQRMLQRQVLSGDVLSQGGQQYDKESRLEQFKTTYCNPKENGKNLKEGFYGLEDLCGSGGDKKRRNKDVNYTHTVEDALTLKLDYTSEKKDKTEDEEDVFALGANLYAHDVLRRFPNKTLLANDKGDIRPEGAALYMQMRALAAKRSVATNSFAAITGMKAEGDPEVAPFMKRIVEELGLDKKEIDKLLGENPSYFAQMEVMSKTLYENPNFYMDLYDKPVNVERKTAVMEAIGIMQERDIYDSLIRSEAVLAVLLETLLTKEQDRLSGSLLRMNQSGDKIGGGGK